MASYATVTDFAAFGLRDSALPSSITPTQREQAIAAASAVADGYLGARFRLPLASWGVDLTQAVCKIAAFDLLATQVGFNPESGANAILVDRKNDAMRWLEHIAAGKITPAGVVDSTPSAAPGGPAAAARAFSQSMRGW